MSSNSASLFLAVKTLKEMSCADVWKVSISISQAYTEIFGITYIENTRNSREIDNKFSLVISISNEFFNEAALLKRTNDTETRSINQRLFDMTQIINYNASDLAEESVDSKPLTLTFTSSILPEKAILRY